jgi:RNA 3'-phosphate cyclase
MDKIIVDGSYLESGGQILRTAVALSTIKGLPCKIINIRKGRPVPGLRAQHLKGIESAALLCDAEVKNLKIGAEEIEFLPKKLTAKNLKIDVGTAGSITLILQTIVPIAIFLESSIELEMTGGTHVKWSPPFDYFQHVFCYFLKRMGVDIEPEIIRYGFYPKGGGKVRVYINPCKKLKPLYLEKRKGEGRLSAISIASKELEKAKVAERQVEGVEKIIKLDDKRTLYSQSHSIGSSIFLCGEFENCKLGSSGLGERGKPAENVGLEAAEELKKTLLTESTVDEHMSDQLLPFIALAEGESLFTTPKLTNHAKTNMWVINHFLKRKFEIEEREKNILIRCR